MRHQFREWNRSVELLLNVCWLVISVASFAAWAAATREPAKRSGSTSTKLQAIALFCALVLLFFPISLTDDLHPEIFTAAEPSVQKRDSSATLSAGAADRSYSPSICALPSTDHHEFTLASDFFGLYLTPTVDRIAQYTAPPTGRAPPQAVS